MKRTKKKRQSNNSGLVNIILIATLFLFYFTGGKYVGYYSYYDTFSGGAYNIADIYETYSSWIDLFLFLLIFLGLGQSILGEHFKDAKGGKAVYVGLGIFLSFALLLWEQQTGFSLLKNLGPYAFVVFLLLLGTLIYKWVHNASSSALIAGSVTYFLLVIALMATPSYYGFYDLSYQFPFLSLILPVSGELPILGIIIAVVFLLMGIFKER